METVMLYMQRKKQLELAFSLMEGLAYFRYPQYFLPSCPTFSFLFYKHGEINYYSLLYPE